MQIFQNRNNDTFKQTLIKGQAGEIAFQKYCTSKNIILLDVRTDKAYQKLDIDFVGNNGLRYEVKTEFVYGKYLYRTQRFYIEDIQSQSINSDGWYRYCQANVIINYDAVNSILYMFKLIDLKEYIDKFYMVDEKKVTYCKLQKGSCGYLVYIKPFFEWLQSNKRYNEAVKQ